MIYSKVELRFIGEGDLYCWNDWIQWKTSCPFFSVCLVLDDFLPWMKVWVYARNILQYVSTLTSEGFNTFCPNVKFLRVLTLRCYLLMTTFLLPLLHNKELWRLRLISNLLCDLSINLGLCRSYFCVKTFFGSLSQYHLILRRICKMREKLFIQ